MILDIYRLRDIQIFENVKISLSGTSTRWDPKLSYSLKLDKKNDTSLFGYKNLKLRSLTKDPSYIRENVCYNVFQSAGLAVSGFSYVRLFINNQPIGLFGLIETFQDPWAAAVFANGDPNYKAGRMFQGRGANIKSLNHGDRIHVSDLHYESDISNYNAGQYDIKTGSKKKENESYKELQEFTKFINESTAAVRKAIDQSEWEKVLDVNGLLRAMALEDILGLADSYMTLSNNFYLYKDPNQKGRITYIPADMDSTLGFTIFFNLSSMTSGSYASHPAILFRPLTKAVLAYPDYLKNYKELRFMLTKNLVNSDTMNPYIDSVVKMIRKDVEWDSTLKRVGKSIPQSERIFGPKEKNVTNIFSQIKQYFPPGYDLGYIREREPTRALPLDDAVGSLNISKSMLSVKEFIAQKSLAILQSQQE